MQCWRQGVLAGPDQLYQVAAGVRELLRPLQGRGPRLPGDPPTRHKIRPLSSQ